MKLPVLCLCALGASTASAATISISSTVPAGGNVHGAPGTPVALKNAAGEILPPGMRLRLGFFLNYTPDLDAVLRSPGGAFTLMDQSSPNQFIPLGESPVRPGYGADSSPVNVTKLVSGSVRWNTTLTNVTYSGASLDPYDDNTLVPLGPARGTRLFLFAYNYPDLLVDPDSPGFEYGLFSAGSWLIPETGNAVLILNVGTVDQPDEVFWGAIGNSLHTAPAVVPEPAAAGLSIAAGLAWRRRRRR